MKKTNGWSALQLLVYSLGLLFFGGRLPAASGEDLEFELGTLPAGSTITLSFEVVVDDPFPRGVNQVATQGRIADASATVGILTDDPSTPDLDQTATRIGAEYSYRLGPGWSLVSLPIKVDDPSLQAVYPGALALLAHEGATFEPAAALQAGRGYWLGLSHGATRTIIGAPHAALSAKLPSGWSLVGTGDQKLDVGALKEASNGRLVSVFGFDGAYYLASSMLPGAGYWVHMNEAGTLDLLGDPNAKSRPVAEKKPVEAALWAAAGAWRQPLQLGVESEELVALPPVSPVAAFDVRFAVGNMVTWQVPFSSAPAEYPLHITGEQVELSWGEAAASRGTWILQVNEREHPLVGSGSIVVDGRSTTVLLRQTGAGATPRAHHLAQNYPNPFNPTTTIRYEVHQAGHVDLHLYDVTGQRVRRLVRTWQPAGSYRISWDGRNERGDQMANGIYLYELRVGAFRAVRKMVLMK